MKLNRRSYEISQKVLKYIQTNNLIQDGSHIIVGLSSGADSVCLLHMLNVFREAEDIGDFTLEAVHVHHGIRQESADSDAEYAREFCDSLGIPVAIVKRDIPKEAAVSGETCEECARRVRYEIFDEKAKPDKSLIAVAHHIDDQAETVLFRMARGTGIKGLRAMLPQNGKIIRPLLCLTREEIIEYIDEQGLSYCVDETNDDINYSRNRIRHNIMPELRKLCPEVASHIALLSQDAKEADDYLEECASSLYKEALIEMLPSKVVLDVQVLKTSKPLIIRMLVRQVIDSMTHSLKDVSREHVDSIVNLLDKNESSKLSLPKKMSVVKEAQRLIVSIEADRKADKENGKKSDANDDGDEGCLDNVNEANQGFYSEIDVPGHVKLPDGRILMVEQVEVPNISSIPQNVYTKWLDYDRINAGFCVRNRREGDYIISDSAGSHKSISRYMIDCKIPKSKRDEVLLVASGSEVYWIIGYRISENVKVSENTNRAIRMDIKESENG